MTSTRKRTRASYATTVESGNKRLKDMNMNVVVKLEKTEDAQKEKNPLTGSILSDQEADYQNSQYSGKSAFEERRIQNLKENAEFLASLGILKAKEELFKANKVSKPKKEFKQKKPKVTESLPRRSSLRIQRIDPEGQPVPVALGHEWSIVEDPHPRKPNPLVIKESVISEVADEVVDKFLVSLQNLSRSKKVVKCTSSYSSLSSICLTEERVVKVVKNRAFSLAFHPTTAKILVCAGDKWGQLGFYDESSSNVLTFEPHSRPINCLLYSPSDDRQLFSGSYDGTLKCMDLGVTQFVEVFRSPEDFDNRVMHFDFLSPSSLVLCQDDGSIIVKDIRSDQMNGDSEHRLCQNVLKTVHSHPIDKQYVLTASNNGMMAVWDLRYMRKTGSKSVDSAANSRSVNSAYFSPVNGQHVVSANMENKIRIHSFSGGHLKELKSFRHDNHVGRWLTNFRPTWHPQHELFVSGSMNRPRQIELFNIEGNLVKSFMSEHLVSVCSLNMFHPALDVLAGVNSSGRVHVFK